MINKNNNRSKIALFIHETYGTYYPYSIISGVSDAAQQHDLDLFIVCGSELESPRQFFRYANGLYQWVGSESVDGVIITSTLFNHVGREVQQQFCDQLKPLPIRILGPTNLEIPNTVIDNSIGLREIIRHLITVHGRRKLAFVKGPAHNQDAMERFRIYQEVLSEYKITYDPNLVAEGDFLHGSGEEAVHTLLDNQNLEVDAIIASNDDMALGVLNALLQRGIEVPEQIAVTGFDDFDGASAVTPSLSTVRSPVYEQAFESVELIVTQMQGEPGRDTSLPTEPVYRRSCGCLSSAIQKSIASGFITPINQQPVKNLSSPGSTAHLYEEIEEQYHPLHQVFLSCLQDQEDSYNHCRKFLTALDDAVKDTPVPREHSTDWHVMLSMMREQSLPDIENDPETRAMAGTLCQTGHVLISERLLKPVNIGNVRREVEDNAFQWITRDLITTFDVDNLMSVISGALPDLGIPECYVGIYEDIQNIGGATRLILKYEDGKRIELDDTEQRFASPQILIRNLLSEERQHVLVMESLHFRDECFGFVIFGIGDSLDQINLHISLRESISGGLKGARLVQEADAANQAKNRNKQ